MGRTNRSYSKDFKLEALRLYEQSGKSAAQVEDELGISRGRLHHWRMALRRDEAAFPGTGHAPEAEAELRRLQRDLARVTEERDILKKAVQFFSKEAP